MVEDGERQNLCVGIVGAGVAGLAAACTLRDRGFEVLVFERESSVGGRTLSLERDGITSDLGAQFIEVTDKRFSQVLKTWKSAGVVQLWTPKMNIITKGRLTQPKRAEYHAGTGMQQALCQHLAEGLRVLTDVEVQGVRYGDGGWLLIAQEGGQQKEYHFDAVISAVPPEATHSLLFAVQGIARFLSKVRSDQAWTLCLTVAKPLCLPFEIAVTKSNPILTGFIRQNGKPSRNCSHETWWLQTKPEWASRQQDAKKVENAMLRAFCEEVTPLCKFQRHDILWSHVHCWPTAWVPKDFAPAGLAQLAKDGCIHDGQLNLAVCGDWVSIASGSGGSIQGAYLSGATAAQKLSEHLHEQQQKALRC